MLFNYRYKIQKKEALSNIEEENARKKHYVDMIAKRGDIIVQIRKSMQFIFHVCKHVSEPIELKKFTLNVDSEPSKIEEIDSDGKSPFTYKVYNYHLNSVN